MIITKDNLEFIKRHLNVTFSDVDNDLKIQEMIEDGIIKLQHILGKDDVDFFKPSQERILFKSYMDYCYNNCEEEFEEAYSSEINRIRRKYSVMDVINDEKKI